MIIQKKQQEALFWNVRPCCSHLSNNTNVSPRIRGIFLEIFITVRHLFSYCCFCLILSIPRHFLCEAPVMLHLLRWRQQGERQHVVMLAVGMLSEVSATIVLGSTYWCLAASSWHAAVTAVPLFIPPTGDAQMRIVGRLSWLYFSVWNERRF